MNKDIDTRESTVEQDEPAGKESSRREFLKMGGMGLAGVAGAAGLARPASVRANPKKDGGGSRKDAVEDIPVVIECAINETRKKPYEPKTVEEHITEMVTMLDAGAGIAHNHSKVFSKDPNEAAEFYGQVYREVFKKHPHAIVYPTINLDMEVLKKERRALGPGEAIAHHRVLAEQGLTNMVMFDTGVSAISVLQEDGTPLDAAYYVYQFWPEDIRFQLATCADFGCGAAVAVYEPGWMKNIVALARAGTLPRGSKINLFFGFDNFGSMPPPVPEALELYLKMMEGLDLKWSVGCPLSEKGIMDTPLAQMALERGGHLRVGLEDYTTGPTNLEQLEQAKELVAKVGRRTIHGADAIEYLDIPFPATRPS